MFAYIIYFISAAIVAHRGWEIITEARNYHGSLLVGELLFFLLMFSILGLMPALNTIVALIIVLGHIAERDTFFKREIFKKKKD